MNHWKPVQSVKLLTVYILAGATRCLYNVDKEFQEVHRTFWLIKSRSAGLYRHNIFSLGQSYLIQCIGRIDPRFWKFPVITPSFILFIGSPLNVSQMFLSWTFVSFSE